MVAELTIGRTDLRYGYFYGLRNTPPHDSSGDWIIESGLEEICENQDDFIISPHPTSGMRASQECTVVDCAERNVKRYECSLDSAHGKEQEVYDYEIDLTNMSKSPISPFLNECDHVIINQWLADRLKVSGLKGFRILPTRIGNPPMWHHDDAPPLSKIFQLAFDGRYPSAIPHVEPPSADKCPHCGIGPILCPECGFCSNPCVKCGEDWGVPSRLHEGPDDPRIRVEEGAVIDPRRWDDTDLMGYSHGGYITRRALDWLLSIHAGPFIAQPVPVNVFNLTQAQMEHLESARNPLLNVSPPRLEKFYKKPQK